MTLDKAIEVYEFWANAHERDAEYHRPLGYAHESIANVAEMQAREERQIAEWLKELKAYRETYPYGVEGYPPRAEPQFDKDINVRSKDEPQTCSVNGRPYSECADCEHFRCTADEPQTEIEWWDCIDHRDMEHHVYCTPKIDESRYEPQTETDKDLKEVRIAVARAKAFKTSDIDEPLTKCDLCKREGDDICLDCERKKQSGKE